MNRYVENSQMAQVKRSRFITTIFVIVIFFFGTLFTLKGDTGAITAQVNDTLLGVVGTYGDSIFVSLDDVEDFWLTDTLEKGVLMDGEETKNTCSGKYKNQEFGEYTLHIYSDSVPYIVIQYGDGNTLVFNQGRERFTRDIYEDLQEAIR